VEIPYHAVPHPLSQSRKDLPCISNTLGLKDMRAFWVMLVLLSLVLLTSGALVLGRWMVTPLAPTLQEPLSELVPADIPGWISREIPIAQTPEGAEKVSRVLRYDEAITREYRRGTTEIIVYAAYWKPATISQSEVGYHNPDTCWRLAGWKREDRAHARPLSWFRSRLFPAEWGVYEQNNHYAHVVFWHIAGGRLIQERIEEWRRDPVARIKRKLMPLSEFWREGLRPLEDQLFLRISSNQPFTPGQCPPEISELFHSLPILRYVEAPSSDAEGRLSATLP